MPCSHERLLVNGPKALRTFSDRQAVLLIVSFIAVWVLGGIVGDQLASGLSNLRAPAQMAQTKPSLINRKPGHEIVVKVTTMDIKRCAQCQPIGMRDCQQLHERGVMVECLVASTGEVEVSLWPGPGTLSEDGNALIESWFASPSVGVNCKEVNGHASVLHCDRVPTYGGSVALSVVTRFGPLHLRLDPQTIPTNITDSELGYLRKRVTDIESAVTASNSTLQTVAKSVVENAQAISELKSRHLGCRLCSRCGGQFPEHTGTLGDPCLPARTHTDAGHADEFQGWYDVQGCGACNDYCRWIGSSGSGGDPRRSTSHVSSHWSCSLAGAATEFSPPGRFSSWPYTRCAELGALDRQPANLHIWIDALQPFKASVGWGTFQVNTNNHGSMDIGGLHYTHGFFAHAPSDVRYKIRMQFEKLRGCVGLDDQNGASCGNGAIASIRDQNGATLFTSLVIHGSSAVCFDLGVKAVTLLQFEAHPRIGGNGCDEVEWVNVMLSKPASSVGYGDSCEGSLSGSSNPAELCCSA